MTYVVTKALKFVLSVLFVLLWLALNIGGCLLLLIPQLLLKANGKDTEPIKFWMEAMEFVFDEFRELL